VTEIDVKRVLQHTDGRAWEVLIHREAWDVHQS
jgi:hypothetical protein